MTYTRKQAAPAPTKAEIEAARHEAIKARAELHNLTTATTALNGKIADAKTDLTTARETLTKILIEIEVTRAQAEAVLTAPPVRILPPPRHGGALGLRRAAREIADHEKAKTNAARRLKAVV
jgi:chromosome segregation ATPase